MKLNRSSLLLVLLIIIFSSCSQQPKYPTYVISFGAHYENNPASIFVNNKMVWDSILTTNYSIGRAKRNLRIYSEAEDIVTVRIENQIDTIKNLEKINKVLINYNKGRIEFSTFELYPVM